MNLIQYNRMLRSFAICNVLAVMIFFTSCFAKQKVNDDVPASRYRLTITLAPGTGYSTLNSVLSESKTTNNLNFRFEGAFQDSKFGYRSISFLFNSEEDLNDFHQRLQSEGIPIQTFSIQKLD
jgi:hypothetical protein